MALLPVRQERTGWRDEELSLRHRTWGFDCPCVDIDFLLIEYDRGKSAALVEYKHERAPTQMSGHPSYRALIDLGNRASLPVFAVRYAADFSWYRAIPLNRYAQNWVAEPEEMTERQWVETLYKIRGRDMPEELFDIGGIEI